MKWLLVIYLSIIMHEVHCENCCVPTKWEGIVYGAGDLLTATSLEAGSVSYDADDKKFAISGVLIQNGIRTELMVIDDHGAQKRYLFEPVNRECKTTTIGTDFPDVCVPDNAKEVGTSYVGTEDNKLSVKGYTFPFQNDLFDVREFIVLTTNGCIPVSFDVRGTYNNTRYFNILNYIKITTGIKDTSVFTPPDYCTQTIMDEVDNKVLQKYSILWL